MSIFWITEYFYSICINYYGRKEGKYVEAITKFEETENYKDSVEKIKEAKYQLAINHFENKDYENAKKLFTWDFKAELLLLFISLKSI